MEMSDLVQLNY